VKIDILLHSSWRAISATLFSICHLYKPSPHFVPRDSMISVVIVDTNGSLHKKSWSILLHLHGVSTQSDFGFPFDFYSMQTCGKHIKRMYTVHDHLCFARDPRVRISCVCLATKKPAVVPNVKTAVYIKIMYGRSWPLWTWEITLHNAHMIVLDLYTKRIERIRSIKD